MLGNDDKYPEKSVVEHSKEKFILFNFVNLSRIFCQRL